MQIRHNIRINKLIPSNNTFVKSVSDRYKSSIELKSFNVCDVLYNLFTVLSWESLHICFEKNESYLKNKTCIKLFRIH